MRKGHELTSKKDLKLIIAVMVTLGVGLTIYDFVETRINYDNYLQRNSVGAGNNTEELELEYLDEKTNLEIEVKEQSLSESEIEKYFDKAIEEIDASYLGKNKSASEIHDDLVIKKSYVDGIVKASWQFDNYSIISSDGKVRLEKADADGTLVTALVTLSYEESERLYSFSVIVSPYAKDSEEGLKLAIKEAVYTANDSNRESELMELPKTVDDINLIWKKKMDFRGLKLVILGIAAVVAIKIGEKSEEKKVVKVEIAQKEADYPLIVSELSILMGAGMSFRGALEKMTSSYQKKKEATGQIKAGYEDMAITYRRITDGAGEIKAIESLGKESNCKEYRKLAMLLSQNLKKGSRDLLNNLEKEEMAAFEMRKQRAIRLGEEASTKLLLPMGGMLMIVMVILIVPALMQMNI